MSFSTNLLTSLLTTYGYLAVLVFVAIESTGIPFPGETMLLVAAVYAGTTHQLSLWLVIVAAATGAILGDNLGFWAGREGGFRLLLRYGKYIRLDDRKLKLGQYLFLRYGSGVVFVGRFIAVLRAWAAFLAGTSRMSWPRFLVANGTGGILWALAYGLLGYYLGDQVHSVTGQVGIGLAVVADVGLVLYLRQNLRRLEDQAVQVFPGPLSAEGPARPVELPRLRPAFNLGRGVQAVVAPVQAAATEVVTSRTLFGRSLPALVVMVGQSVWGLALVGVAGVLLVLRAMQITDPLQVLLHAELREDPHDLVATFLVGLVPSMSLGAELLLGLIALALALVQAAQVWALWRATYRGPHSPSPKEASANAC